VRAKWMRRKGAREGAYSDRCTRQRTVRDPEVGDLIRKMSQAKSLWGWRAPG